MVRTIGMIGAIIALVAAAFGTADAATHAVNYVSSEMVYIDAGKSSGLSVGAKITVLRAGAKIATLEVRYLSSRSAGCVVVEKSADPKAGDAVSFKATHTEEATPARPMSAEGSSPGTTSGGWRRSRDRVRGALAIDNYWSVESDGSRSSFQPGVSAHLVVDGLFGTAAQLRIQDRLRLYHRSYRVEGVNEDDWTHRLTEFAVVYGRPGDNLAMAFGRLIAPEVRGVGSIDGAYFSHRVSSNLRLGIVGGAEPDPLDATASFDRSKVGLFAAYELGDDANKRLESTLAVSGSYRDNKVDREFVYIQNVLSLPHYINVYQSVEVDYNRSWRLEVEGKRVRFSNLYLTGVSASRYHAFSVSYDARKLVRDQYSLQTPDSLFDERLYTGYNSSLSLNLPAHVGLRFNTGIRYRDGSDETNRYYSVGASVRHLPAAGHRIAATLTVSETPDLKASRPVFSWNFPVKRKLRLGASAGGYRYESPAAISNNAFTEIQGRYTFSRYYYAAGSVRRYFGDDLESTDVYTEVGVDF